MDRLDDLLIRDWLIPSDVKTRLVYHYTSAAGLIGILSSGVIRGTNAPFLSDSSEIAYGLSICNSVLSEERTTRTSPAEQTFVERVIRWIQDDVFPQEVYVTSLSARRDVLSQWRGYGSPEGRFCIGFQLAQFSERDVLRLPRRVAYHRDEQKELVRRAVARACDVLADDPENPRYRSSCEISLSLHLHRLMCSFKHGGFEEEEEWRSVTTITGADDLPYVGFEPLKGLPRPYVTMLSGSRTSAKLPVVEVCIGPTDRKAAAVHATRLLLSRYGYDDATVTETDIPFAP